jgi:hypothetical protein
MQNGRLLVVLLLMLAIVIEISVRFDSLASHSLSLRPSRPSRGFPSRSVLNFARNDRKKKRVFYPTAAMTLSSMAIGVGNAPTPIVVRVGFGLLSPAKYSA